MHARQASRGKPTSSLSSRRDFLAKAAALAIAPAVTRPARAAAPRRYRVAVIGHTGRGDYGHGLDTMWLDMPNAQVVAVADADQRGLAAAVKRLGQPKGYLDYRRMLDEAKPELVSICPRWLDQHCAMVVAAAQRGVRGIYLEKPMCRSMAEADAMVAACEKNKTALAIAFQTRYSQKLPVVAEMIRSGKLGQVVEYRARGKEDRRGGGEDLWVLGSHMFNLIHHFGGKPLWCFATVEQDGRPVRREDFKPGAEGIGPLAGDAVHARYHLASGVPAYFDSVRNTGGRQTRFGLEILGSEGVIQILNTGHLPETFFLPDANWSPGRSGKQWIPVSSAGLGKPEPLADGGLAGGNLLAIRDLIEAIEQGRPPLANIHDARIATEMIVAVFQSQRAGGPVAWPLSRAST